MLVNLQSTIPAANGTGHRILGMFIPNGTMKGPIDLAQVQPPAPQRPLNMAEKVEVLKADKYLVIVPADDEAAAAFPRPTPAKQTVAEAYGSKEAADGAFKEFREQLSMLTAQVGTLVGARAAAETARAEIEGVAKQMMEQRDEAVGQRNELVNALKANQEALKLVSAQVDELKGQVGGLMARRKAIRGEEPAAAAPTTTSQG